MAAINAGLLRHGDYIFYKNSSCYIVKIEKTSSIIKVTYRRLNAAADNVARFMEFQHIELLARSKQR